jgi:hypothetical protein
MIIAHIFAGLGNQLFQYAAARRLAYVHETVLKLDLHDYSQNQYYYSHSQNRRFGLDHFNITAQIASWRDVARLCPLEGFTRVVRRALPDRLSDLTLAACHQVGVRSPYDYRTSDYVPGRPVPGLRLGRVVSERFYHFDPAVLSCPDDVCLTGFWQSEKYFQDVSEVIRRELSVKTPLTGKNDEVARQILASDSVSLHVRRGDKALQEHHLATTPEFCERALTFFRAKLSHPRFFVFTDDWEWVQNKLSRQEDVVFVDHNHDEANYEDLRLMSLCRHNIIAPSSFSWWGAWLNANPAKIVVRPRALFNLANHDVKDVCPPDWIILDA